LFYLRLLKGLTAVTQDRPQTRDSGRVLRAANIMIPSVNSDEAYLRTIASGAIDDYGPAVYHCGHRQDVARLLAKLGTRDRVRLVITAYETGLVSAPR
jgi:hypothetical protein